MHRSRLCNQQGFIAGALLSALACSAALLPAGCGSPREGDARSADPAAAALQQQLDRHPPTATVPAARVCAFPVPFNAYEQLAQSAKKYQGAPALVRVRPAAVAEPGMPGSLGASPRCWDMLWTAASGVKMHPPKQYTTAVLGRYVVEKAGAPDQYGVVPFRAHAALNAVGAFLEKANPTVTIDGMMGTPIDEPVRRAFPQTASDAHALTHRNADGENIVDGVGYGK